LRTMGRPGEAVGLRDPRQVRVRVALAELLLDALLRGVEGARRRERRRHRWEGRSPAVPFRLWCRYVEGHRRSSVPWCTVRPSTMRRSRARTTPRTALLGLLSVLVAACDLAVGSAAVTPSPADIPSPS